MRKQVSIKDAAFLPYPTTDIFQSKNSALRIMNISRNYAYWDTSKFVQINEPQRYRV